MRPSATYLRVLGGALTCLLILGATPGTAAAQGSVTSVATQARETLGNETVPSSLDATAVAGVSIDETLYQMLLQNYLLPQNAGHTGTWDGVSSLPHFQDFNDEFMEMELTTFEAILAAVSVVLPALTAQYQAQLALLVQLGCGGTDIYIELEVPVHKVVGAYELRDVSLDLQPDGLHYQVTLDDVGVLFTLEVGLRVGTQGSCTLTNDYVGNVGYDGVVFDVRVGPNAQGLLDTSATLIDSGSLEGEIDAWFDATATALILDEGGNFLPQGPALLTGAIDAFVADLLPAELETLFRNMAEPLVPQSNGRLDLSHFHQNQRFFLEGVEAAVSSQVFAPFAPQKTPERLERKYFVGFDTSDPVTAPPCAPAPGTLSSSTKLRPSFESVNPASMGTLWVDSVVWEQPTEAARLHGVGQRTVQLPGSGGIDVPFLKLEPELEAMETMDDLFVQPTSFIAPIPLTAQQITDLMQWPTPGGPALSTVEPLDLSLQIGICPVASEHTFDPLGPAGGSGTLRQDVLLTLEIVRAAEVIMSEDWNASFESRLVLRHDPLQSTVEVHPFGTQLTALFHAGNGLSWDQVTSGTPVAMAPVMQLLRGFFGDPNLSLSLADPRLHGMIEGLTAPLAERTHHGMVVLPGLDLPATNLGDGLQTQATAFTYYSAARELGFDLQIEPLCASIQRWGSQLAVDAGGTPSAGNPMLVLEVSWGPWEPEPDLTLPVSLNVQDQRGGFTAGIADVWRNPSRYDDGYVLAVYDTILGDRTRLLYASGAVFTAGDLPAELAPVPARHYVAATAAGYERVRQEIALLTSGTPATLELRPYRVPLPPLLDCSEVSMAPRPTELFAGYHHAESYPEVYEAIVFQTGYECGVATCNSVRLVWEHLAPSALMCFWIAQDIDHAPAIDEGTLRGAASDYQYGPCFISFTGQAPRQAREE